MDTDINSSDSNIVTSYNSQNENNIKQLHNFRNCNSCEVEPKTYELFFKSDIKHTDNIRSMIHNLYNKNTNFYELMNSYNTLFITKSIHHDRIRKFKHFTGYFNNHLTGIKSNCYHFYVKFDKICSITKIENIL